MDVYLFLRCQHLGRSYEVDEGEASTHMSNLLMCTLPVVLQNVELLRTSGEGELFCDGLSNQSLVR